MTIMTNSMPSDTSPTALPEGWRLVRLEQIAREYISGGTPSTKQSDYWDGNIAWTTSSPISEDDVSLNTAQRFISERGIKESASRVVPRNSLLVGTRVGVGKAVVNLIDIAISQDLTGIVLHDNVADPIFIVYQFKTGRVQQFFDDRKRGTTIKGISRFDLQSLLLNLPPLAEQRAIASTLRAAQAAVQARRRAIELERERKAALMQVLFTKGTRGEATKMTEIGEVPESWEVVRLGEKITLQRGFDLPNSQRMPGPFPVVSSSGITGTHSQAKVKGPGVITGRYGTLGEIHYIEDDYWPLNTTLFVSEFRGNDPLFVSYFLATVNMQSFNDKTSVPGVNRNHVHATTVAFPPIAEQREIAEALRACDEVIAGLEREAELHEELFRALLEELMTGRSRVSV